MVPENRIPAGVTHAYGNAIAPQIFFTGIAFPHISAPLHPCLPKHEVQTVAQVSKKSVKEKHEGNVI